MSLVSTSDGGAMVLDQVNGRIVRFGADGRVISEAKIPSRAAQDLALGSDGSVAVLDRLGDKRVDILGADGRPRASFALEGRGIQEGGAITGVFVDGDSVYVERAHAKLVRLGDTSGKADPGREEILGRPLRDNSGFAHAWMDGTPPADRAFVAVNDRQSKSNRFTRRIDSGAPIFGISLLDSDRTGTIYLGLVVADITPDAPSSILLVCLSPADGTTLGTSMLPLSPLADETLRELSVNDSGGVTYLYRTEAGAELLHADCRGT
jgi:hypothetical protein